MTEVHSERRRTLLQWLAGSAVATGIGADERIYRSGKMRDPIRARVPCRASSG